jgi:hypothetical protein
LIRPGRNLDSARKFIACDNFDFEMAIFFITAVGGPLMDVAVDSAVAAKLSPQSVFKIESGKWMVKSDTPTSQNLSTTLGLAGSATHLVISVGGYFGRANPALWEWMATQAATK